MRIVVSRLPVVAPLLALVFLSPAAAGPFPSDGLLLLDQVPLAELGPGITSANDCWGYVSPSGREYALIGTNLGTTVVEITDPENPVVLDSIPGPSSFTRDIKTYLDYAYVGCDAGGGIQVIDLTQVDSGIVTLLGSAGAGGTHNVAIDTDSGFLYRCGGGDGLPMYSLADPTNPTLVGQWDFPVHVHDAQVVTYDSGPYAGQQIAFCSMGWEISLRIVDVTDKSNPVILSTLFYPNGGYTHQGWLSEDRQYFYLNDEFDEINLGLPTTTHVIDVSDLSNAVEVSTFTSGTPATDHNLYVRGDLIFEANYRSGLRVFDASADPTAPVEIAYFDTYPPDDDTGTPGLWSNYPYFPSGNIIGSDIGGGLFIWSLIALPPTELLVRGDANDDGSVDIGDGVFILNSLFVPAAPQPPCPDAADTNDDGSLDIGDGVYLLNHLFVPAAPPPPPPATCGEDPTGDGLGCDSFGSCP